MGCGWRLSRTVKLSAFSPETLDPRPSITVMGTRMKFVSARNCGRSKVFSGGPAACSRQAEKAARANSATHERSRHAVLWVQCDIVMSQSGQLYDNRREKGMKERTGAFPTVQAGGCD